MSISNKVKWKFASDQTNSNNSNNSKFYIDNDNEQIDTEMVDLSAYKHNFYFREPNQKKFFDFYQLFENTLFNDESVISDLTDEIKLEKSINYIYSEIHDRWMKKYDKVKSFNRRGEDLIINN